MSYLYRVDLLVRRLRPDRKRRRGDSWRREAAREAGMLHGVRAYNEAMGWD